LPICCADTDAIVAIIEHPKTATPTTTTDPANIVPPCTRRRQTEQTSNLI
jgi:hypothetical protein